MPQMTVLQITLCLFVLSSLNWLCQCRNDNGLYNWKECTWKQEDGKDEGVIWECTLEKLNKDTPLLVYYEGNIRISGCSDCCNRWYFTFNGVECSSPGAIDGALHQANAGNVNKHEHVHIEGFCHDIPAGNVKVEIRVGKCVGTGKALGNAYTGFATTSRIFVDELRPDYKIYY